MSHYSNPTENAALGSINREWNRMRRKAERIALRYQRGEMTDQELAASYRLFPGIFRVLLVEALKEKRGPQ